MKFHRSLLSIAAALTSALISSAAPAQEWGYEGAAAPNNWGTLDPKFTLCATGKNQSPIDLDKMIGGAQLKPLRLRYAAGAREIVNTGHTVQVNYARGSVVTFDDQYFQLIQFNFHAPSENRIGGKSFPLEAHLVHADKAGNLAVVAVMFSAGAPNALLTTALGEDADEQGRQGRTAARAERHATAPGPARLLPLQRLAHHAAVQRGRALDGMKSTVTASKEQIEQFAKAIGHPNNRPLQPINARPVLK